MSLKLTLAALALGLAAATDCCTYDEPDGPKAETGCSCSTEPDAGCFKTGEEPFSFPQPGPGFGFRPSVLKPQCDPVNNQPTYPAGEDYVCAKDDEVADGITKFCCGGFIFDLDVHDGKCRMVDGEEQCCLKNSPQTLPNCFAFCAFNWCDGEGPASGFMRVPDPENEAKTICLPATDPPTPSPVPDQFECPAGFECTLGVDSSCDEKPGDLKCCPLPTSRRRRLNFYQSTGCCQEACE